jgi:Tol biopolymer transport system component
MTGVFLSDSVLQAPVPEAWLPAQQAVVFNAASGDSSGLWAAPLALAEGRLSAALRRITFGSASEAWPAVWPDGSRILFSSLQTNIDIWSLRLDASTGKARGEPERITQDLAPDHGPALSPDGSLLAFTSTRFGNQDIWIKDLATGNESLLAATPFADWFPLFSPDGTRVAFSSGENTRYPLYIVTRGAAAAEKVCEEGGLPTSWSADGNRVFIAEDIEGDAKISVVDVSNGRVTRLIGAPGKDYFGGRVSPDGGWLVFTELTGQMRHVGFVAPMNELSAPAWARTDLTGFWSPDGRFLYNLSDRDGFFCLWARPFNPSAPADGAVFPVFHSHQARRRIANIPPAIFYLSLKAGRLVFPMGERTGNIWMMELKP